MKLRPLYLLITINIILTMSCISNTYELGTQLDFINYTPTISVAVTLDGTNIPEQTKIVSYDSNAEILGYIFDICDKYPNVDPYLVESVIYHESRFKPSATNGDCKGLMQVSSKWHKDRMTKLGVFDLYDPYSNILVGVDILNDLLAYNDTELALMCYNMSHKKAKELYANGIVTPYASDVIRRAEEMKGAEIQ